MWRLAPRRIWALAGLLAMTALSLGGADDSPLLRDAVDYADSKGALVVAAAGNRGVSTRHYPAAIPTVLAVGGVTDTGARYDWSNFGGWVGVTRVKKGGHDDVPAQPQAPAGRVDDGENGE